LFFNEFQTHRTSGAIALLFPVARIQSA
jgi:hypothetical protein